jgi:hypothetical protein
LEIDGVENETQMDVRALVAMSGKLFLPQKNENKKGANQIRFELI